MYNFLIFICIFNLLLIANIKTLILKFNIYDNPTSKRKFHLKKTSLIGGFVILINIFIFCLVDNILNFSDKNFLSYRNQVSLYFFSLIIYLVGLFDDKYDLEANNKLVIFFFIILSAILVNDFLIISVLKFDFFTNAILLKKFSVFFTIFCVLLFVNAFNMFDGINLQSGIYSFILFFYFLINDINFSFSSVFFIAIIFFLILNYKNLSFLGNSGSYMISFCISLIILANYNLGKIKNVETIFILMMIPGLDMIRVSFQRLMNGKNPFKADRNHLHHLLIKKFSFKVTNLILSFLILVPILLLITTNSIIGLITGIILYTLVAIYLNFSKN